MGQITIYEIFNAITAVLTCKVNARKCLWAPEKCGFYAVVHCYNLFCFYDIYTANASLKMKLSNKANQPTAHLETMKPLLILFRYEFCQGIDTWSVLNTLSYSKFIIHFYFRKYQRLVIRNTACIQKSCWNSDIRNAIENKHLI